MRPREHAPALGIVVGLAAEYDLLSGSPPAVRVQCARGAVRAGAAAEELCARGVRGLVSFGIAGAVAPTLASGDLLIPDAVHWHGSDYTTDAGLRACLDNVGAGVQVATGKHAGVDAVVGQVDAKRALFERTGALALDEESGALAAVASALGVPLLVVRAVADTALQTLPDEVKHWTDASGRTRHTRVLTDVLKRPSLMMTLPSMARGFSRALATLRQCREPLLAMAHTDT